MDDNVSNDTSDKIVIALRVFTPLISEIAECANCSDRENVKLKLKELFEKSECLTLFTDYNFAEFTLGYFRGVAPEAANLMLENETAKLYLNKQTL